MQIKQQENNVVGVLFLIFCTMCTLCLHNISRFLPTQAETRL
ncbi:putative membrane protein [Wolbachia endosymbiont of Drosophila ananassae]|nr:putative membrane protein [Wolbachia endosymbiont of Drosophila ananassae]RLT59973.1 putative membrane protein [Wolbachia endosymbiont of Drosophila ananassae]RLT60117.1 putative membrane protein [Wolbachia endosymbiont of Drosophila ananassae]